MQHRSEAFLELQCTHPNLHRDSLEWTVLGLPVQPHNARATKFGQSSPLPRWAFPAKVASECTNHKVREDRAVLIMYRAWNNRELTRQVVKHLHIGTLKRVERGVPGFEQGTFDVRRGKY